jgi:dihydropyrimidinase
MADALETPTRDTLIRGGLVVNGGDRSLADVLVQNGKISRVEPEIAQIGSNTLVVDAKGMHVMPAGVDPHVHLTPYVDDFASASRAAIAGGVTTIGVMAFPDEEESISGMLVRMEREARAGAHVDTVFHSVLNWPEPPNAAMLADVRQAGQTTCKLFTISGQFDERYSDYAELLREAKQQGILPLFHCEDNAVIAEAVKQLERNADTSIARYEESRPILSEELSVHKVLALCELTGCPVYIVHVSSARALAACTSARKRGLPVLVETRPIYLHLTSAAYATSDGALYVSFPPIRREADQAALWNGLRNGEVDTLGSDHAPLNRVDKFKCGCSIHDPQPGMSNLQEMLPLLYGEGVLAGKLTAERFVQLTSTNAAKILNLYPRKGAIVPGADADLAIWDPLGETVIGATPKYSQVDHTIFEGRAARGRLHATFKAGFMVFSNGVVGSHLPTGKTCSRHADLSSAQTMSLHHVLDPTN